MNVPVWKNPFRKWNNKNELRDELGKYEYILPIYGFFIWKYLLIFLSAPAANAKVSVHWEPHLFCLWTKVCCVFSCAYCSHFLWLKSEHTLEREREWARQIQMENCIGGKCGVGKMGKWGYGESKRAHMHFEHFECPTAVKVKSIRLLPCFCVSFWIFTWLCASLWYVKVKVCLAPWGARL